MKYVTSR